MSEMDKNMAALDDLYDDKEFKTISEVEISQDEKQEEEEEEKKPESETERQTKDINSFGNFIADMEQNLAVLDDLYPVKEPSTKLAIQKQLDAQTSRQPLIEEED